MASPPPAGGGVSALFHLQVQQRLRHWGRASLPGTAWGRAGKGPHLQVHRGAGRCGGLTSTYSSGNIPILSLSFPSAQLSSTLLITVKTSSWKWPTETSPGTCTKTDTETEPRDQSVSLMLKKDSEWQLVRRSDMKTVHPPIFTRDRFSSLALILEAKTLRWKCMAIYNLVSTLKFVFLIITYG